MRPPSRILILSTRDTCRSAMAAAFLRELLRRLGGADVSSAGTLAAAGAPVDPDAVRAMFLLGIDIRAHRAHSLAAADLRVAEAIVVMEEEHARAALGFEPECAERICRLWERSEPKHRLAGIADPRGGGLENTLDCRDRLLECLRNWALEFLPLGRS